MTKTDIFNKALGLIGHSRTITEGEVSMIEYVRCDREWDGARIAVLSAHDWNWLADETQLTLGAEVLPELSDQLEYAFDRPDDNVRLIGAFDGLNRRVDHRSAGGMIYTKSPEVKFRFVPDSIDPDEWPQSIIDAISAELASRIAFPMTANAKTVQAMKQIAIGYKYDAIRIDADEQRTSGSTNDKYAKSRR